MTDRRDQGKVIVSGILFWYAMAGVTYDAPAIQLTSFRALRAGRGVEE